MYNSQFLGAAVEDDTSTASSNSGFSGFPGGFPSGGFPSGGFPGKGKKGKSKKDMPDLPEGFTPPEGVELPEGFTPPEGVELPEGFTPPGKND